MRITSETEITASSASETVTLALLALITDQVITVVATDAIGALSFTVQTSGFTLLTRVENQVVAGFARKAIVGGGLASEAVLVT